jgi:hypothetical protein
MYGFELSKKDSELCIVMLISVNARDNFCTTDAIFVKLLDNKNVEYHLLALSIALQSNIYIYSTFRIDGITNMQSLKNAFDSALAETRGHLLYRSPQCFQFNRYSVCKLINA